MPKEKPTASVLSKDDLIKTVPTILRLAIDRFRGIESLTFCPRPGVNIILGGGDVGKTTILDAVALLLSPTNSTTLSDTDYFRRNATVGFVIEAVMSLPTESGIDYQMKPSWPWEWNDTDAIVPSADADSSYQGHPVYRLRVRGTEDLDLVYEIVQPDGTTDHFSATLRRSIGLVRLGGDDRNDRDLRLVQGSALDRLLSDKSLRARVTSELAKSDVSRFLQEEKQAVISTLNESFKSQNLPQELDISIVGGQGASIISMVGLTAKRQSVRLPLTSWGAGTRRLSSLVIAEQNQGQAPITIVDEVERGLEPYRQLALTEKLQSRPSQAFITTHSPFVIKEASRATFWYLDSNSRVGILNGVKIARVRNLSPGMFLSRLAIAAEGETEVGFVKSLLARTLPNSLKIHGVHVCNCGGNEETLEVLEALAEGGLRFAGFADEENGRNSGRWSKVANALGPLLFRWRMGCIEQNIIGITPDDKFEAMLIDPAGEKTGDRLRSLATRLEIQDKTFASIQAAAIAASIDLKTLIIEAALGKVPEGIVERSDKREFEKHAKFWFKTEVGGRELERKVFALELWPQLRNQLFPFCLSVLRALDLSDVADLRP